MRLTGILGHKSKTKRSTQDIRTRTKYVWFEQGSFLAHIINIFLSSLDHNDCQGFPNTNQQRQNSRTTRNCCMRKHHDCNVYLCYAFWLENLITIWAQGQAHQYMILTGSLDDSEFAQDRNIPTRYQSKKENTYDASRKASLPKSYIFLSYPKPNDGQGFQNTDHQSRNLITTRNCCMRKQHDCNVYLFYVFWLQNLIRI